MFSFKSIVLIAAAFALGVESSGVAVPTAFAAPVVAPAQVGYAHAVPQNIPPYAAQVSYVNRVLSPLAYGPVAAPIAAPFAAPLAAPFPAPFAAPFPSPYLAGPGPAPYAFPGPIPAAYAAPYPYSAPITAPAFVR